MTSTEYVDVAVVGAGPAGLSTAIFLALQGVSAKVFDRRGGVSTAVKATGQYPHTMEAMRLAGLADAVAEHSRPERSDFSLVVAKTLSGPVVQTFASGDALSFDYATDEKWGTASQSSMERILDARARELGVHIDYSTPVDAVDQQNESVALTLGDGRTVRARYVVAADGWRSEVRRLSGITLDGRGVVGRVSRVLFRADLTDHLAHTPGAADASRFAAIHVGRTVVFNTEVPGLYGFFKNSVRGSEDYLTGKAHDVVVQEMRDALGAPDLDIDIEDVSTTEIACGVASNFVRGRVILAGDAAHIMPPTGGMGGNTAYTDGMYLAWRLALVVRGQADPELLQSYDAERRPYAQELVEQQFANMVDRIAPELRDPSVAQPLPPDRLVFGYRYPKGAAVHEVDDGGSYFEDPRRQSARPGSRIPFLRLGSGSNRTSTTRLLSYRFTVVAGREGDFWREALDSVQASLGLDVDYLRWGHGSWVGDEDEFARVFGIGATGAVLVRPDRIVAWRSLSGNPVSAASELLSAFDVLLRSSSERILQ
ncbi:FAD-dependent monooxygenase [Rhodococcoides kyotonense]|uniref:2-polyprenyl-6-methoxyphenol hydroxylase n=1 Tax=Rhodococcoides kyotonense TaxID=398843 RepID=A0A239MD51_9NOCA|nr:FAD-dependent monooxygenase [Rhodococcus kyotonensis]SNT39984.1 2-polyprenyl-6-methoxyphenol hydroxylase [Rhodococcus kyotonensis]